MGTACKRSPQEQAARYLRSGKSCLERKDYNRAAIEFRNAARVTPKDAEPEYELGLAFLGAGDINQAIAALYRATRLNPKHEGARIKVAELMARSGDPEIAKEGEKRMRELLASSPGNTDALNTLALSELALGELEDAEQHLQQALQKLPNNLASSVQLAMVYIKRQNFQDAEEVLKKAQAAAPQSADAAEALGQFYIWRGRLAEAEAAFQSALRITPDDASALLSLAAVELRLGKKDQAEQAYKKLAALPDRRYQHLHAAYLFADGQREASLKEFEKLAKASPNDRPTRNRLVAAYLAMGQVPAAENVLGAALQKNSNDADALLQRSQILAREGKLQEAENDLNQVIHFKPDSPDAHYMLSYVYGLRNDRARQNAELNEALRYNPAFLPARVSLAQLLSLSRSPKAALELLDATPEAQKGNLILLLERNLANYAAGDLPAFRDGVAVSLRAARTPDVLLQDAVAKLSAKDYAGARASIDEVLRESPDNLRALRAKAYTYTAQNQNKEAGAFLAEYAARSRSAPVQVFIGESLWSYGDRSQGRAALERAKSLDPKYAPADLALAQADLAEGKTEQARTTLSQLLTTDPANYAALVLMASLESSAGDPESAAQHYRKALEQQPRNPAVLNNLAYLLLEKLNQPDEALTYAQQALEIAPDNPNTAGTLGWVFYRKGLYRDALQYLTRASAQDGNSTERNAVIRRYHLAMTYLRLGDRKKGTEILAQALAQNPNLAEAQMAQALVR